MREESILKSFGNMVLKFRPEAVVEECGPRTESRGNPKSEDEQKTNKACGEVGRKPKEVRVRELEGESERTHW